MTDNFKDKNNQDKQLDKLVRAAMLDSEDGFSRPSDSTIEAYLLGTATGEQKENVRSALIRSAAFRREMLSLAEDIDSLTDTEVARKFEQTRVPSVPELKTLLQTHKGDAETDTLLCRLRSWIIPDGLNRWLAALFSGRTSMRLAQIGVAVSAVLVLLFLTTDEDIRYADIDLPMSSWVQETKLDMGLLVPNVTRTPSAEPDPIQYFASHLEAAEAEFSRIISFQDGSFAVDSTTRLVQPAGESVSVLLRCLDESGKIVRDFTADVPVAAVDSVEVRAWLLELPSRGVHSLIPAFDSVSAELPFQQGAYGCLVFTYFKDGKFAAVNGIPYSF